MSRFLITMLAAAAALAQGSDYDQGVARFEAGDLAGAVPFLARAAKARPGDAQVWKALGVAYAAQKMYHAAEEPLRRACRLDPQLPDACYFYARDLYALGRFEESMASLERANQKSWKVQLAAAQAMEALSRAEDAEHAFRSALTLARGNNPAPGVALGLFLVRQGRPAEAIQVLHEVITRFPNSADGHLNLGRALLESDHVVEAIGHLERAVALTPDSPQAHLLLAKALVRAGRAAEAKPHFEAAEKLEPDK